MMNCDIFVGVEELPRVGHTATGERRFLLVGLAREWVRRQEAGRRQMGSSLSGAPWIRYPTLPFC